MVDNQHMLLDHTFLTPTPRSYTPIRERGALVRPLPEGRVVGHNHVRGIQNIFQKRVPSVGHVRLFPVPGPRGLWVRFRRLDCLRDWKALRGCLRLRSGPSTAGLAPHPQQTGGLARGVRYGTGL